MSELNYTKEALEIVKSQASVRPMTEDEIINMTRSLAAGLAGLDIVNVGEDVPCECAAAVDPKKAIKDRSITCMECGKSFKIITRKHLATHGLTPASYKEKWGLKKGTALACRSLARERRKKMKDMKLWERRGSAGNVEATA